MVPSPWRSTNPDLLYFIPAIINQITSPGSSKQLLDFGGIVEFNGNPTDGWTLDSWNGTAIPSFPDPLTELFVLTRDLALPPQELVYNVTKALLTGNPQDVVQAVEDGVKNIIQAILQTPTDALNYIKTAVADPDLFRASFSTGPSDLVSPSGELPNPGGGPDAAGATAAEHSALLAGPDPGDSTDLLPATELSGLAPGDLGSMIHDLLTS